MTRFVWTGRTRQGTVVHGEREGASREAVTLQLRREQILATRIEAKVSSGGVSRRVDPRTLAIFTRQLSVMVDAGLPIVGCLDLLAREEPDRRFAGAIEAARVDVEGGLSLAEALARHPRAFDVLYTNMVAAGEAGGVLDTMLDRLSTFIEKQATLAGQVRAALAYPSIVLGIAGIVVGVMLWKVVPAFAELFQGLGAELPMPTRVVIWTSERAIVALPFLAGAGVVGAAVFGRYRRDSAGRLRIDRMLLGVPLVGPILRKVAVARFCRTLGTLLRSGVPILDGLDITARTAGNAAIELAVTEARQRIERGESLARPLKASGVFPPMVVQMVGAGESTGALDVMLGRIADFYDEEVDRAVTSLLTMLEPVLICILGLVVGAIVISMYLPLFDVVGRIS